MFRPQGLAAGSHTECEDEPNWANRLGQGCDIFRDQNWCTEDGGFGEGWSTVYVTPDSQISLRACVFA